MHYLTELYIPKPKWLTLDLSERRKFFEKIRDGMTALSNYGVEAIAFGKIESGDQNAAPYQFFGIWRFPDADAQEAFLSAVASSGWNEFFATINAGGEVTDIEGHFEQLASVQHAELMGPA